MVSVEVSVGGEKAGLAVMPAHAPEPPPSWGPKKDSSFGANASSDAAKDQSFGANDSMDAANDQSFGTNASSDAANECSFVSKE